MGRVLLASANYLRKKLCYTTTILCTSLFLRYAKYIFLQKLEAQFEALGELQVKDMLCAKETEKPIQITVCFNNYFVVYDDEQLHLLRTFCSYQMALCIQPLFNKSFKVVTILSEKKVYHISIVALTKKLTV